MVQLNPSTSPSNGSINIDISSQSGSSNSNDHYKTNTTIMTVIFSFLVVVYPLLCRALRFRRINQLHSQFQSQSQSKEGALSTMTRQQAHHILQQLSDLEFPSLFEKGLQFALFRTYGIPSIAALLVKTAQLSSRSTVTVGKRYADTAVLVAEIYGNEPGGADGRAAEAFARLNFLHGHYRRRQRRRQQQGENDDGDDVEVISNLTDKWKGVGIKEDDMLYTLALFAREPVNWINRYEWRKLTNLEICAVGVFHHWMGEAMEISFAALPSCPTTGRLDGKGDGWRDGLHFYNELIEWADHYERQYMVPNVKSWETAVKTRDLLLATLPRWIHGFVAKLISAAMDDRLRKAVMFDDPPRHYRPVLDGLMEMRRWWLRHLTLPRMKWWTTKFVTDRADSLGRRHLSRYDTLPIYVKPTLWNRWGPFAWMSRVLGVPLPGDKNMYPEGFLVKNVGPQIFDGQGSSEMERTKELLTKRGAGGCPFPIR